MSPAFVIIGIAGTAAGLVAGVDADSQAVARLESLRIDNAQPDPTDLEATTLS